MERNLMPSLLTVLGLLLLANFLIVPLLEWQEEKIWSIQQLDKRVLKSEFTLASSDELEQEISKINSIVTPLKEFFYDTLNESEFRLERQKELELILKENEFELVNLGWKASAAVIGTSIVRHSVEVRVSGPTSQFPMLSLSLSQQAKRWQINTFSMDIKEQSKESLGKARVVLSLSFYQLS